ncbi:MAG: hypothetical protein JW745_05125 [Sedimentisphaerales bacterium]|nr:hypothetical protein [Sedimentisphaerales bacterium]MBN2843171.1 hypothetical protein [Sedimentisphaerales bacterium]
MQYKKDNRTEVELREANMASGEIQQFIADLDYVDQILSQNAVDVPSDLAGRIIMAVNAGQVEPVIYRRSWPIAHMRALSAVAAMLLVVLSLTFYYFADSDSLRDHSAGQDGTVALAEGAGNPFSHPSLLIDMLMDRSSSENFDTLTLEAVSELWDTPHAGNEPASLNRDRFSDMLV